MTTPPEMFAFEAHHTPADVWAVGVVIGWMLTLADPMGELSMPEWEDTISASPPKLPVFSRAADPPWDPPLEEYAVIARRCCSTQPDARPTAAALQSEMITRSLQS